MISEKLGLTVAGAAISTLAQSGHGGRVSLAALEVNHADVVVMPSPGPVVVVLEGAPATGSAGRPQRAPGSGTAGWSSVPAPRTSSGSASTGGATSTGSKKSSGPLAFLDDSKMSVDEKIFRLSLYMTDKADKELEKKIKEISGKQSGTSSSTSASGSSGSSGGGGLLGGLLGGGSGGGLLGGLGGVLGGGGKSGGGLLGGVLGGSGGLGGLLGGGLGDLFGGGGPLGLLGNLTSVAGMGLDVLEGTGALDLVTQLSGPVLAAGACAFGCPMLAPAAMQLGPSLVGGALGALEGVAGGGSGSASGSGKAPSSSSSGAGTASAKPSSSGSSSSTSGDGEVDKKDLMELEYMQQKQQQMFSLLSNLMKGMHDTRMSVIGNIRT